MSKTAEEIYNFLKEKKYQTEYEETGEYLMYYSNDMPKILTDYTSQLQTERDNLKEKLEAIEMADRIIIKDLHDKLESSERENKELKAEVNFLESKYDTLQNTDRQIIKGLKSQLSSLKEQKDKLKEFAEAHEQWEADVIMEDKLWWPNKAQDVLRGKIYDTFLELQAKRNEVLSTYKQTKG